MVVETTWKRKRTSGIQDLPEVQVLKTAWAEESGEMAYADLKKYDGHAQIQSLHNPEARYSCKRHFEWVGDKVQVSETDDEGYPHIITDIVATSSNRTDYEELPSIQERLEKRECKPAEHYVDAGYMSGPNLSSSQKNDIDLIGPLANFVTPQDLLPNGITQSYFQIDATNNIVICPKGHIAKKPSPVNNSLSFRFPPEDMRCL